MSGTPAGPSSKPKVESTKPSETSCKCKRGMFQKDWQHKMYGYGDEFNPLPEYVALLEDIVVEYVTDLVHKAQDISSKRGKLLTEDFLFLMRKCLLRPAIRRRGWRDSSRNRPVIVAAEAVTRTCRCSNITRATPIRHNLG